MTDFIVHRKIQCSKCNGRGTYKFQPNPLFPKVPCSTIPGDNYNIQCGQCGAMGYTLEVIDLADAMAEIMNRTSLRKAA